VEFEGALYHVISRGNYRKDLFDGGAAGSFERTLFEACEKCGWLLHAYPLLSAGALARLIQFEKRRS